MALMCRVDVLGGPAVAPRDLVGGLEEAVAAANAAVARGALAAYVTHNGALVQTILKPNPASEPEPDFWGDVLGITDADFDLAPAEYVDEVNLLCEECGCEVLTDWLDCGLRACPTCRTPFSGFEAEPTSTGRELSAADLADALSDCD